MQLATEWHAVAFASVSRLCSGLGLCRSSCVRICAVRLSLLLVLFWEHVAWLSAWAETAAICLRTSWLCLQFCCYFSRLFTMFSSITMHRCSMMYIIKWEWHSCKSKNLSCWYMWNWLFPRVFCSQQKSSQYQRTIRMDIFLLPLLVLIAKPFGGPNLGALALHCQLTIPQ